MIHIKKSTQPKKFQEFKQQNPQAHFDDMPPDIKAILRQSLLEEQGYLCAYCMSKICDKVKIEHYEPRNPQNELEYSNSAQGISVNISIVTQRRATSVCTSTRKMSTISSKFPTGATARYTRRITTISMKI